VVAVPDWEAMVTAILEYWANYWFCCIKMQWWKACPQMYEIAVCLPWILVWVVQDKLASRWRPSNLKLVTSWIEPAVVERERMCVGSM